MPLLGLLHHQLSDKDARAVAHRHVERAVRARMLIAQGDIAAMIRRVALVEATPADEAKVERWVVADG